MNVRRRDIGLLPAPEGGDAVFRIALVVDGMVYYADIDTDCTATEREVLVTKAIDEIKLMRKI